MKLHTTAYLAIQLLALPFLAIGARAQEETTFQRATDSIQQRLEQSVGELEALREELKNEKVPLARELNELEAELTRVRSEYQDVQRVLDGRTLDLSNLGTEIASRESEAAYLSNLLSEYGRNFEASLHVAELERYADVLDAFKAAQESSDLGEEGVYERQVALLNTSLERLFDALGGTRFAGSAVDPESGLVRQGTFALIGPAALFRSEDGTCVGAAEQRIGSLGPAALAFSDPRVTQAADDLVRSGQGVFPLDPTLGNAHKIEATEETFVAEVEKGGAVMIPIFVLAGLALLVGLYKWLALSLVRRPSAGEIQDLLEAVEQHDTEAVVARAAAIRGPTGRMLQAGVEHIEEPTALIEEVMYESVLKTRLQVERFLPFVSICAASAPLLGLLGTVTGIISTFKLITVFGSGDVKSLSGGISEALITTKYGLIVAIPSLLVHAFLSRKARGVVSQMETAAVAFVNQVSKSDFGALEATAAGAAGAAGRRVGRETVEEEVRELFDRIVVPVLKERLADRITTESSSLG